MTATVDQDRRSRPTSPRAVLVAATASQATASSIDLSFAVSPLIGVLATHAGWDVAWSGASGVAPGAAAVATGLVRKGSGAALATGARDSARDPACGAGTGVG